MPPFHLIGVAKEDWSPFSLRINSLYSTSFVKYGFSVKPFKKNLWKIRSFNGFRGEMEYRRVIFASSSLCSFSRFCLFPTFCHLQCIFWKSVHVQYNPCDPFLLAKFLDLRNCQLIQIWHYFVLYCNSVLLNLFITSSFLPHSLSICI